MAMAAWEAERRQPSSYVFLAGHALLVLGYIFFTVGFATDYWLTTDFGHHGLWEKCVAQLCSSITSGELSGWVEDTGWVEATQAMQTMALMCYMLAVLLALSLHCVKHTFDLPHATPIPCTKQARVLEIFTGIGCAFCLIGVSVFGGKGQDEGTLGYSYALSVFSLFLSTIGTVMVAVTREAVTNNALNRVTPHQQAEGMSVPTVTNPHLSQSLSSASYSYGRGQRNPEQPRSDGGQNGNPYPYGHGATSLPPGNSSQPLPYTLYPQESGNTGHFGAMTMPEPSRPIAGDGRGMGQSQGPGRLPPISEMTPSAPPPLPEDGDQPPSYLEAISQPHS